MRYPPFLLMIGFVLSAHGLDAPNLVNHLAALQDQLHILEDTPGPDALKKARFVQRKIDQIKAQMGDQTSQRFLGAQGKAERLTTTPTTPHEMMTSFGENPLGTLTAAPKKKFIESETRDHRSPTGVVLDGEAPSFPPLSSAPPPFTHTAPTSLPLSKPSPSHSGALFPPPPQLPHLMPPHTLPPHSVPALALPEAPLASDGRPLLQPSMVVRTPLGLGTIGLPARPSTTSTRPDLDQPAPQHSCSHDPRRFSAAWK